MQDADEGQGPVLHLPSFLQGARPWGSLSGLGMLVRLCFVYILVLTASLGMQAGTSCRRARAEGVSGGLWGL